MKPIFAIVLLCLATTYSFGQHRFAIKVYQNTDFIKRTGYDTPTAPSPSTRREINFNRISLAINFNLRKKITHELELFIPEISESEERFQSPSYQYFADDSIHKTSVSGYSLRYEVAKGVLIRNEKIKFTLGIGANPSLDERRSRLSASNSHYANFVLSRYYRFSVNFIPRINFILTKRFTMDLNLPIKIYDFMYITQRTDDPWLRPSKGRRQTFFDTVFVFRVGLRYHFA